MASRQPVLSVTGLSATYGSRRAVNNVNLQIRECESVALIGPNGCGKSTFLRTIAGLVEQHTGYVALGGLPLRYESASSRIRHGLGYLKQTHNVFANISVRDNLELAAKSLPCTTHTNKRIDFALADFPVLTDLLDKRAGLLSGGQRQSLATAMVLIRQVRLLLLDEPIAGLSPKTAHDLLRAVRLAQQRQGFSMILVEHRLRLIHPHVNRVLVMRQGALVDDTADTEKMLTASWVAAHFRVEDC